MKTIFDRFIPFIMPGIIIVVFLATMMIFSYLLFWGMVVGLVLFAISWVREKLSLTKKHRDDKFNSGRIIEHK